ncbi:VanZ family protein [Streptomyces albus subsp. chlorinus]|uniref:VanZ family protein n=1 Tax=Streptomyces albus TaxID=1888 RepID=UPI0031F67119
MTTSRRSPRQGPLRLLGRVLAVVLAFAAMVVFAALLSRATLEPRAGAEGLTHTNLRPGASLRGYLGQPSPATVLQQLGGNVLLGVPFGVLLPVMAPHMRGFAKVTVCAALVMLLVETVQGLWVTGRAFDVDDVLLNAAGALLGYLCVGRRLSRAVHVPRGARGERGVRGERGARGERGVGSAPGARGVGS